MNAVVCVHLATVVVASSSSRARTASPAAIHADRTLIWNWQHGCSFRCVPVGVNPCWVVSGRYDT